MDFMLSDADRVLISQVREFGKNYFNKESVAQWRRDMGLPDEVVKAFVDLDFNGFGVAIMFITTCLRRFLYSRNCRAFRARPCRSKTIFFSSRFSRLSQVPRKPTLFALNTRILGVLRSLLRFPSRIRVLIQRA